MHHSWVRWLLGGIGVAAVLALSLRAFWAAHQAAESYARVDYAGAAAQTAVGPWLVGLAFLPLVFLPILLAVIALRHGGAERKEE